MNDTPRFRPKSRLTINGFDRFYAVSVNALMHMTAEQIAEAFDACEGRSKHQYASDGGFGPYTLRDGVRVFRWAHDIDFDYTATCLPDGSYRILCSGLEECDGRLAFGPSPLSAHYREPGSPEYRQHGPVGDEARAVPADFNMALILEPLVEQFGWKTLSDTLLKYVREEPNPANPPPSSEHQWHTRTCHLESGWVNLSVWPSHHYIVATSNQTLMSLTDMWRSVAESGLLDRVYTHGELLVLAGGEGE